MCRTIKSTAYHEPSWVTLTVLVSFLYLLQVARTIANHTLGAGLLGEIAVGIVYGPVAGILPEEWRDTLLVLGYIGLILIVFEGGLDFEPALFLPALPVATLTALIGVLVPLAFTFALFTSPSYAYPAIQAFTAGSALASTSLGTTLFVLRASSTGVNFQATRVGATLLGAALIDDVIALVLLAVITRLGESGTVAGLGWTIGRPVLASILLAVVGPALAFVVARPVYQRYLERRVNGAGPNAQLAIGVLVLSGFLATSYYAGTTMLLGAFLAGVFLYALPSTPTSPFKHAYEHMIAPLQAHIFAPIFFASIGFTIPFLSLWTGRIIWRGIVYSILMALGKLLAGVTLVLSDCVSFSSSPVTATPTAPRGPSDTHNTRFEKTSYVPSLLSSPHRLRSTLKPTFHRPSSSSIQAALFIGLALIARGEIGLIVLQVAHASEGGVLGDEAYEVAIWAVGVSALLQSY
ncbi:solute:hydrogen antiporter [Pseudohyphozyma bogoriensis]|nr:solute:hydrogen antiporter [Pseudohyphozyma bogoriensis]